ncbi:RdRP-domain-containing protein [Cytidiella melzeri]|nr:RdRP-domain-containing protein [Cytidiella melzeri]
MELHIRNIDPSANPYNMKRAIATALHGPDFRHFQVLPINFEVAIFPQATYGKLRCGALTLPTEEIGRYFLQAMKRKIRVGHKFLIFRPSARSPRLELVRQITMLPYVDPKALEEREGIVEQLRSRHIPVIALQFGWECRNGAFSVEWEKNCMGWLIFDLDKREYRMTYRDEDEVESPLRTVAMRSTQIAYATIGGPAADGSYDATFFLSLLYPPTFEAESSGPARTGLDLHRPLLSRSSSGKRQRLSELDEDHASFVQYTSLAVQFRCLSQNAAENLSWIADLAHVKADGLPLNEVHLGLFSSQLRLGYAGFLQTLDIEVAFQVEALVRNHHMDFREVLDIRRHIEWMVARKGGAYTAAFIRHLAFRASELFGQSDIARSLDTDLVRELWLRCRKDFEFRDDSLEVVGSQADTFMCLHVTVMPSRICLGGPFPEKNNRVMRQYAGYTSNFLRVSFADDSGLQYRMDRDVDDRSFIHARFGGVLQEGLHIAGHHFEFLAYSQSGLKQHAVWFMKTFVKKEYGRRSTISPDVIIRSIGVFNGIDYDPELIFCPARYGARISQAFTSTEAAVSMQSMEEILILPDIVDKKKRSFTDGVGTMSREFAGDAWKALQAVSRRHARNHHCKYPPAFQIRCHGSKGMLSVDYRLSGQQICLRQSMVKFNAPNTKQLEIVAAFTSPGKFYLNRPLIMMLEDLHITGGYDFLKKLQDVVVAHTERAITSLGEAASLFESYGLGTSFKLASTLLNLHKLGMSMWDNELLKQLTGFAVHHVLRELKYRSRIPVPEGWTLPGIADIHGYLREREIYACITSNDGSEPRYLEGPVMVFRSPTIHPGDIQLVTGIGKPPRGSPYDREPLPNTVVFSIKGGRPLASCLAGGDLDGDEFVCCTHEDMLPNKTYHPASYPPAARQTVAHPSTRADVANFVTEYLYSDSVGLIANAWLLRADSSDKGILDPDCLALAALHSDAVDYPKTGMPVPLDRIPPNKSPIKPDWSCPELTVGDNTKLYYESQRWLGRLFREIQLPEPQMPQYSASRNHDVSLDNIFARFRKLERYANAKRGGDIIRAVRQKVSQYISWDPSESMTLIREIWAVFQEFACDLRIVCASHTISPGRSATLTEEEALVGTIVAKCSVRGKRKEQIAKLREQTTRLFDRTARQVVGADQDGEDDFTTHTLLTLKRAWAAYGVSIIYRQSQAFGSQSFSLLALSEIFDAVKKLEAVGSTH